MIRNQWYAILASKEVRPGRVTAATRMGERMIAWRDTKGQGTVMSELCPHRGAALSLGRLRGDCLECPFHGIQFDPGGKCTLVPANGRASETPKAMKVKVFPTREAHGLIYIWWGEPRPELPPVPWFESVRDENLVSFNADPWPTHYSRGIENQLDVVHIPFVHPDTIGRGYRTVVNGPLVTTEQDAAGEILNIWVNNERDTGQLPRSASQLPHPDRHPSLQFRFPNLWQNWISDDFRLVGVFAPVDDENMVLYLFNFHSMRTPVIRRLFGWALQRGNLHIARQDRRVVSTQLPKRADLDIGEKLIPGDGPIITYRKIRRRLIETGR